MDSYELAFRVSCLRFFERRVLVNDVNETSESVALAAALLAIANVRVAAEEAWFERMYIPLTACELTRLRQLMG